MITTRSMLTLLAAQVAFLAAAPSTRAELVTFALSSTTAGELPNTVDSSKPLLTYTFEDTAPDEVTITFDATNLLSDNFISGIFFNIKQYNGGLSFTPPDNWISLNVSDNPQFSKDGLGDSADAGLFNISITFNTDPSQGDLFRGGETRTAVFSLAGLRATDFVDTSIDKPAPDASTGGWYAAATVGGIQLPAGRVGKGAVGADTFTVVPEPSSFALAGIGGLALAGFAFRRRSAS